MKLTFAELRQIAQLKQAVEQGNIIQAMDMFFGMKNVLDKLKLTMNDIYSSKHCSL